MTTQLTSNENIGGTFECPVCGKDSPHQHRADAVRWYSDHLDRFMTAVNGGEPKERFDWGGTYPHPKDPDAPFRFRQPGYQSLWEIYCRFVEVGLIPERQPNAHETSAWRSLKGDPIPAEAFAFKWGDWWIELPPHPSGMAGPPALKATAETRVCLGCGQPVPCPSDCPAGSIAIANVPNSKEAPMNQANAALAFLNRCSEGDYRIVCTGDLTELQIAEARLENRMWVNDDGIGFVLLPFRISTPKDKARERVLLESPTLKANPQPRPWTMGGNLVGTYMQGYARYPYSRIVEVFGDPQHLGEDGDKVAFQWTITFADGTIASIYDYKASSLYGDGDDAPTPEEMKQTFTDWHIGGKHQRAVELITSALSENV